MTGFSLVWLSITVELSQKLWSNILYAIKCFIRVDQVRITLIGESGQHQIALACHWRELENESVIILSLIDFNLVQLGSKVECNRTHTIFFIQLFSITEIIKPKCKIKYHQVQLCSITEWSTRNFPFLMKIQVDSNTWRVHLSQWI